MHSDISQDKNNWYSRYFVSISIVKDLLQAMIIVTLIENPFTQITFCLIFSLSFTILNIYYRPYRLKRHNFLLCIISIIYFLIDLTFLVLKFTENTLTLETRTEVLGNLQISLISLMIAFTLGNSFYETYLTIK